MRVEAAGNFIPLDLINKHELKTTGTEKPTTKYNMSLI